MIRASFGILFGILYMAGRVTVFVAQSHIAKALLLSAILIYITGCAAIIDKAPRDCYAKAYTVADMTQCTATHKPWEPGLTDAIAQPVLTAERAYSEHKRRRYMATELKAYTFEIDGRTVTVYAESLSEARQTAERIRTNTD